MWELMGIIMPTVRSITASETITRLNLYNSLWAWLGLLYNSYLPAADTSWMSWWRQSARCWRIWSAQQWRSWLNSSSPRSSQSWWLAKLTPAAYQITNILDITLGISVTYHIDNSKFCFNPLHVCVGWTYFDRKRNSTLCLYRHTMVKELLKQDDFTYQNWN